MKRWIPAIVVAILALWMAAGWVSAPSRADRFDLAAFGKVPILAGGRIKPFDTLARNSLVIIHGRQTVRLDDGRRLDAMQWLADVFFNAPAADTYPVFIINHPDVLGLFGWEQGGRKFFSYKELDPFLQKIDDQGKTADEVEAPRRTAYQTAILNLRNSLILYQRLKNSLQPEDATVFADEIKAYLQAMPAGLEASRKREHNEKFDKDKLDFFAQFANRYDSMASSSQFLAVPSPHEGPGQLKDWHTVGETLLASVSTGSVDPVVMAYALAGDAYRAGNIELFNRHVGDLTEWMGKHEPLAVPRVVFEYYFNHGQPFYQSMCLYVLAFLLVCAFWLGGSPVFNRTAFFVLLLALAVHTFGLGARMYLQGRPPVTNLYSSAVFIGWGTVIIGLILERYFRDGIGMACSAVIGFITLIIAHHLAESGDTLEMLQAVLDTNIWLATHVVVITLGYSAMFLAGMLAILYVVKGVCTRTLTRESAQSLARMTFGVLCFATLFSFVGTVLGGIWADQSWGRFWGWDPKENGALLIVLWCAIILHARLGGFIRQRGLMIMALFGNIITSFSWFGVNMLGVGLHSYGFMNKAFPWLMAFVASQVVLMVMASLPSEYWRSNPADSRVDG